MECKLIKDFQVLSQKFCVGVVVFMKSWNRIMHYIILINDALYIFV